jgi:hypothetical protein
MRDAEERRLQTPKDGATLRRILAPWRSVKQEEKSRSNALYGSLRFVIEFPP